MALRDLTDPAAVSRAVAEYDERGASAFLAEYGFGRSTKYLLRHNGSHYDVKAIAAAAHGYQFPDEGALRPGTFTSGLGTTVPKLRSLGFEVVSKESLARPAGRMPTPLLDLGRVYSWEELGELFDFEPGYLTRVGGMVSRPRFGAILLITHPGGARTIDYGDYWDGDDLIYTGHGQRGDQERTGTNRDTGDNARALLVFEQAGSRQLKFLGEAECVDEWLARAPDVDGNDREVIRFRLSFETGGRVDGGGDDGGGTDEDGDGDGRQPGRRNRTDLDRAPRPFDPSRRPTPRTSGGPRSTPEEIAAAAEKANQGHHDLLVLLDRQLRARGWTEIEEIPAAIDLRARDRHGRRVLFEAKTVAGSELERLRSAAIQLLEYRFFYGARDDALCVITDRPVSDRRTRFLTSLGVAVVYGDHEEVRAGSPLARQVVSNLLD